MKRFGVSVALSVDLLVRAVVKVEVLFQLQHFRQADTDGRHRENVVAVHPDLDAVLIAAVAEIAAVHGVVVLVKLLAD